MFFWYQSIDLKLYVLREHVRFIFKFRFRIEIFDFRVSAWLVFFFSTADKYIYNGLDYEKKTHKKHIYYWGENPLDYQ
jgi:hypothetical protein